MGGGMRHIRSGILLAMPFLLLCIGCENMDLRNACAALVASGTSPENAADPSVLAAPSGLTVSEISGGKLPLTWTDNSANEVGFGIQEGKFDPSSAKIVFSVVAWLSANVTTWGATGLISYYRILAYDSSGNAAFSNIASQAESYISEPRDTFTMGDGTLGSNTSETISHSFNMSKSEVTNSQFEAFALDGGYDKQRYWTTNGWASKVTGGWIAPAFWGVEYTGYTFADGNQPVIGVSWYEAVAYCNWRSEEFGFTPAYDVNGKVILDANGFRLPTEVEWEYAAAKGLPGQAERIYGWGSTWDSSKAVCSVPPASPTTPAAVGSASPGGDTPQGLADMSGNVFEWCSDVYEPDSNISSGTDRYHFVDDSADQLFCIRGGAWDSTSESALRCAARDKSAAVERPDDIGFRMVYR